MYKKYLQLNNAECYKTAFLLSNFVWEIVKGRNRFSMDTVGRQFVRAVDSISANVAEGFGRYGKTDRTNFYRYAYGSVKESLDWNEKSKLRKLLTDQQYVHIFSALDRLPKFINQLIKYTNLTLEKWYIFLSQSGN